MIEDVPQAGENDPDGINPFKFAGVMLAVFAVFIVLSLIGWPS